MKLKLLLAKGKKKKNAPADSNLKLTYLSDYLVCHI